MFTLEGVMENMLANTCPREVTEEKGVSVFEFDLHCHVARVTARCLTYGQDIEVHKFEILSYTLS